MVSGPESFTQYESRRQENCIVVTTRQQSMPKICGKQVIIICTLLIMLCSMFRKLPPTDDETLGLQVFFNVVLDVDWHMFGRELRRAYFLMYGVNCYYQGIRTIIVKRIVDVASPSAKHGLLKFCVNFCTSMTEI